MSESWCWDGWEKKVENPFLLPQLWQYWWREERHREIARGGEGGEECGWSWVHGRAKRPETNGTEQEDLQQNIITWSFAGIIVLAGMTWRTHKLTVGDHSSLDLTLGFRVDRPETGTDGEVQSWEKHYWYNIKYNSTLAIIMVAGHTLSRVFTNQMVEDKMRKNLSYFTKMLR